MINKTPYTAIFFSGVEGERFMETAYSFANCRHMLMSILYVEAKGDKWFDSRCKKYPDVKWMIDSGGHSFRTEGFCPKWPDWQWFDDFAGRYSDWLLKNKHLIDLCVNLDIDCLEVGGKGFSKMLEYDEKIFRPLERQGVPVCYVWHQDYGFDYWLKMCREHEYVGLPGNMEEAEYHKMLRPAMMNGCRVHGFACTKAGIMGKVPFATVDSTTWKSGERFGQTFVFESGKLNVYDHNNKEVRQRYKPQWVAKGVDWGLLEQDKAEAVTQVSAIAWGDLQDHIRTMSSKLAYWMKSSRLADDVGDPDKASLEAINALFASVECPLQLDNLSDAQGCLEELQWFLGRHPELMSIDEDNIDWWVKEINADPENTTRVEAEAAIRQRLYDWFYKLNAAEAKPRDVDSVEPIKKDKERIGTLPDVEVGDINLPDAPGATDLQTTPACHATEPPRITHISEDNHSEGDASEDIDLSQPLVDTAFIDSIVDRITRSRASLAFDLLFEQFKLKHEVELLKKMRIRKRHMQDCRKRANLMSQEITDQMDTLPDNLASQIRDAAQEAYEIWSRCQSDEKEAQLAARQRALANRPQNKALAERASEIGRLGGAPTGNQNARKHGLTSRKMPVLACDNCPNVQVCPQYRAGHVCAFVQEFEAPLVSNEGEGAEISAIRLLLEAHVKRVRRALLQETFEGGIINKSTSAVMKLAQDCAKTLHSMLHPPSGMFGSRRPELPSEPGARQGNSSIIGDLMDRMAGAVKDAEATVVEEGRDGSS